MDSAHTVVFAQLSSDAKGARDVRAHAWAFAFSCYRKKAAPDRRPDDAERRFDEIGAKASIQRPA